MGIESASDEFNEFQMLLYLDYNIFTSIISFFENQDNTEYKTAYSLYLAIKALQNNKKVCMPYSSAHIADILQGTRELESKIGIINNLTNGWFVSEDKDNPELVRVDKCLDISEHIKSAEEAYNFSKNIQNLLNPFVEASFNGMMEKGFEKNSFSPEINEKITGLYKNIPVKNIYDLLKFNYKMANLLNEKEIKIDVFKMEENEIINIINNYIKSSWLSKMLKIKNIAEFENFFTNYSKSQNLSTFFSRVSFYSFLSDFIGITKEGGKKIKKETFSSGMINDMLHMSFGLRSHDFVTNDNNLRIKSILCKKLLQLPPRIFSMENYYKYLVNESIKMNFPNENGKEFEISLSGPKKIELKRHILDINEILYD